MTMASSFNTVGAVTSTTNLSNMLFFDSVGAFDGEPFGDSIGGAGEEETGVGASTVGDGEVVVLDCFAILGGDLVADGGEGVHGVPKLLAKVVDDGCVGAVGGRTGATVGETTIGGIGAIEGFETELDELSLLESAGDVKVHLRSELLDGVGIVESLALLVSVMELLLWGLHFSEFLFDGFDVFEELVEIDTDGGRGAHLDRQR